MGGGGGGEEEGVGLKGGGGGCFTFQYHAKCVLGAHLLQQLRLAVTLSRPIYSYPATVRRDRANQSLH